MNTTSFWGRFVDSMKPIKAVVYIPHEIYNAPVVDPIGSARKATMLTASGRPLLASGEYVTPEEVDWKFSEIMSYAKRG